MRLFLFHHAGGSAALYGGWAELFPADWDVVCCDAPGRGSALGLAPLRDVEALAAHFRAQLAPAMDAPFAFFGHSMGAVLAYELALRLEREGGPAPCWVGLSACSAPRPGHTPEPVSTYSGEQLAAWLVSAGGTDPGVARHPLIFRMLEPVLRSDLEVVESWRPVAGQRPLAAALTVFGAHDDALVETAKLAAWPRHSTAFSGFHLYEGGHFYLRSHTEKVTEQIVREIESADGSSAREFHSVSESCEHSA